MNLVHRSVVLTPNLRTFVFAIVLMASFASFHAALPAVNVTTANPALKEALERVYSDYLGAVEREDSRLLLTVLPSARIADLKRAFEGNGMRFPDDYFATMRKYAPKMPPTRQFQFVATTDSERYANLIYMGNMNGYLRKTTDERRFLIVQFERENDGWKYGVVIDPPANLVPDLDSKLEAGQLDFITRRPFVAEKIELRP